MTASTLTTAKTSATRTLSTWRLAALAGLTVLTAYGTGIAWQAQFVSYPLFKAISAAEFPAYHLAYNAAIPGVGIVPGFLSFLACAAFPLLKPAGVPKLATAIVALTGLGSLLATVLWAIPMHYRLDRIGQDAATVDSLLQANAVRTALMTASTAALTWITVQLLRR